MRRDEVMDEMEPLLTIDEVAEYLRVPVVTIRWLRQEGRFASAVKVGRRLAWERSEVAAWVAKQRETAA
jgi:excisionase family DNA binding protein